MKDGHLFLMDLAAVLSLAALTSVLFHKLKQPVVLGYILAGFLLGPHMPVPMVQDVPTVQTLSELGVILLMFSLGLEFSLHKLMKVAPLAGLVTVLEVGVMLWLGYTAGRAMGWSPIASVFAGAMISISSTMIIVRVYAEHAVDEKLRTLVFGILIIEDLCAIILITVLTAFAHGVGLSVEALLPVLGRLALFLVVVLALGVLVVPRVVRFVVRLRRPEMTLLTSVGFCFALSVVAQQLGYSVALGAFLASSLVHESGAHVQVEALVQPIRDMFAAVFFVAVGMLLDPYLLLQNLPAVLLFAGLVIVGKVGAVTLGCLLTGKNVPTSVQAGMSLAQIGEFSFILAALGRTLEVTDDTLFPTAVGASILTTFLTPSLVKSGPRVAQWLDRTLPRPLQTFVTLYGTWLSQKTPAATRNASSAAIRSAIRAILLDATLFVVVVVITHFATLTLIPTLPQATAWSPTVSRILIESAGVILSSPMLYGLLRASRRLAQLWAQRTFPAAGTQRTDLAASPRTALVAALQLVVLLAVGFPMLAITQPFMPPFPGLLLLLIPAAVLVVLFWRSASNLQGHVRAGATLMAEVLQKQVSLPHPNAHPLHDVAALLPGFGTLTSVQLEDASHATHKTLAQLNLRGLTGATIVAIVRGGNTVLPSAHDALMPGDTLALMGADDAVESAQRLLLIGQMPANTADPA
jgi:CPA2 family monovalent cation:H+ antiporter-2